MAALDHPPAFQFYPQDFAADAKVESMSTEEVGAYILLLCKAWRETPPGSIPDDDIVLARWARLTPDRWTECRTRVLAAFSLGTDSRWHQKRMRREFQQCMKRRKERQDSGRKGAASKWLSHSGANGSAINQPMANDGSSSSSSSSNKTHPPPGGWESAAARLYEAYPRREAKKAAVKAAERAIRQVAASRAISPGEATDWLHGRVSAYAASPYVATTAKEFIPLPASWFNAGRYDDPDTAWGPRSNGKAPSPIRSSSGAREGVS